MRISDWSSDVCSSDLTIVAAHHADKTRDRARLGLQPGQFQPDIEIFRADANADHPPVTGGKMAISRASPRGASKATNFWSTATRSFSGSASAPACPPLRQTGRASCRERVCPYV